MERGESRTKKRVRVVVGIYEAGREAPEDNARKAKQQYSCTMIERAVRSRIDEDKRDGCWLIGRLY